jgi:hypothetical protein
MYNAIVIAPAAQARLLRCGWRAMDKASTSEGRACAYQRRTDANGAGNLNADVANGLTRHPVRLPGVPQDGISICCEIPPLRGVNSGCQYAELETFHV